MQSLSFSIYVSIPQILFLSLACFSLSLLSPARSRRRCCLPGRSRFGWLGSRPPGCNPPRGSCTQPRERQRGGLGGRPSALHAAAGCWLWGTARYPVACTCVCTRACVRDSSSSARICQCVVYILPIPTSRDLNYSNFLSLSYHQSLSFTLTSLSEFQPTLKRRRRRQLPW
jgi:hypothetical protein